MILVSLSNVKPIESIVYGILGIVLILIVNPMCLLFIILPYPRLLFTKDTFEYYGIFAKLKIRWDEIQSFRFYQDGISVKVEIAYGSSNSGLYKNSLKTKTLSQLVFLQINYVHLVWMLNEFKSKQTRIIVDKQETTNFSAKDLEEYQKISQQDHEGIKN